MAKKRAAKEDVSQLSIKKFAEIAGISQSALRYYDKMGIFVPFERGDNNYCRYAPFQAVTVNYVNVMVDLGVPLAHIKQLAEQREPADILATLEGCEKRLDDQLKHIQEAYSVVHTFQRRIQRGMLADVGSLNVYYLDESNITLGEPIDWGDCEDFYLPFVNFCVKAKENRINLNYPVGGLFESMDKFAQTPSKPTQFFSVDPCGQQTRGPGKFMIGYVRGYYGEMGAIAEQMIAFAKENNLGFSGPVYVDYLLDEISLVDPSQYIAQVAVAVTQAQVHDSYKRTWASL